MARIKLKTGDTVHIEPMTGFGDPSNARITSIQKRYREKTGKPYDVISIGGRLFDGDTLNAITSPTAYYISGKVTQGAKKKIRKDMVIKSKTVSQSKLTPECWSVQIWGRLYCKKCEFRDKPDCGGKKIRKTGKNAKGFKVPIA